MTQLVSVSTIVILLSNGFSRHREMAFACKFLMRSSCNRKVIPLTTGWTVKSVYAVLSVDSRCAV